MPSLRSANYATYPGENRIEALKLSVESIRPQVDVVRICWNNYKIDNIPSHFFDHGIVNVIPDNDLSDNGKFCFIRPNEYYHTCDDDILYPPDYVDSFPLHKPVTTHHGRILNPEGYYSYYRGKHKCLSYLSPVPNQQQVHVGGTGVMLINTHLFMPPPIHHSPHKKMSDIVFSLECARLGIPILCLPHGRPWLRHIRTGQQTIGNDFRKKEDQQVELLKEIFSIFAL